MRPSIEKAIGGEVRERPRIRLSTQRGSDVLPSVTATEMKEIDRLMVEELGIGLCQMMEQAGRNITEVARVLLGGELASKEVAVLAGPGNNGGGGMVAARHLANAGASVVVVLAKDPTYLREIPARQYATLVRMAMRILVYDPANTDELAARLAPAQLVIDALLGYSLDGPPRGTLAMLIRQVNKSGRPILALDLPSGLHPDTGEPFDPCIKAHATLTLALPKRGLLMPEAKPYVGRLWVGDISVPPPLYARLGLTVGPLFSRAPVIQVEEEGPRGTSAAFGILLETLQVPFAQEIVLLVSGGLIGLLLARVGISRAVIVAALVIFLFRAAPGVGQGYSYWAIDRLGFDQQFLGALAQVSSVPGTGSSSPAFCSITPASPFLASFSSRPSTPSLERETWIWGSAFS